MIEISNLRKTYGHKVALHGLNLNVAEGEIFAFLGPNGAGKTTTIKILTGLLHPDSGYAKVGGFNLATHGLQARAMMSYVPDEPYLYEKLSGREFLHMIGELYGMQTDAIKEKIAEVAAMFELTPFMDSLTEGYSHGMKQRVVIGAALLHNPRVLVIDEPMVGLDPKSVRKVKDTLKTFSRTRGLTVFMNTHSLSVAEEVADRIGILDHGKLLALGSLEEVMRINKKNESGGVNLEDLFLDLTDQSGSEIPV